MELIDTHCHLDFSQFEDDREAVLKRAQDAGLVALINPGASLESSRNAVWLAKDREWVYAGVGLHPHEAVNFLSGGSLLDDRLAQAITDLGALLGSRRLVAVGEIGLDYYRLADGIMPEGRVGIKEAQRALFERQLDLARDANLPIIIHCRDAYDDLLAVLDARPRLRGVVHCFEGSAETVQTLLDRGLFISFTNNVTYKNSRSLEAAKVVPLERMFLETDAPYLPPAERRGERCEPADVRSVAETIARARGIDAAALAEATTKNAEGFFRLV